MSKKEDFKSDIQVLKASIGVFDAAFKVFREKWEPTLQINSKIASPLHNLNSLCGNVAVSTTCLDEIEKLLFPEDIPTLGFND